MKLGLILSILMMLCISAPVFAMTPPMIEDQLEMQISRLKEKLPQLDISTDITVKQLGSKFEAIISPSTYRQGIHTWRLPAMAVYPEFSQDKITKLKLIPKGPITLDTLSDNTASTSLSFLNAILSVDEQRDLNLFINQFSYNSFWMKEALRLEMYQLALTYTDSQVNTISLSDLPTILLQDIQNKSVNAKVSLQKTRFFIGKNSFSLDSLAAKLNLEPEEKGKTFLARNEIILTGLKNNSEDVSSHLLPSEFSLLGTITHLPYSLINDTTVSDGQLQTKLARAGTRILLDKMSFKTPVGLNINGDGNLEATTAVPLGLIGRLNFEAPQLQQAITSAQQLLIEGGSKDLTQAVMVMMALQAMGTQEQDTARFILEFASDRKILLNGQDFGAIVALMMANQTATQQATEAAP